MSEILVRCLPALRRRDVANPKEPPLLLMYVCSARAQIAVTTAALWTTLDLNATCSGPHFSVIFETWFARVRQLPLSVKIVGALSIVDDFDRFSETFRSNSGGMRSLELDITFKDLDGIDARRLAFPLLQDLTVRVRAMLREVLLEHIPPVIIPLPWQQLTRFTGELYAVGECLEILRLMPNVTQCTFSVFEDLGSDMLESLSRPNIKYLLLCKFMSEEWGLHARSIDILDFLTLPNLETLDIREPDSDGEVLDLFLSRSSPPLRRPAIPGDEIDATPLVSVPGLIDLEIFSPPHRLLFHLFGLFRQDPSFLWQLLKLSLLRCQDARWREANHEGSLSDIVNTMATALAARRDTHEGCSQFSLRLESHFPSFSDEELRPLKKLKAEGMVIYVGTEVESIV